MPFTPENAKGLGKKGGHAKHQKDLQWERTLLWLAEEGGESFRSKLKSLSQGSPITKEEKEFMLHFKDLLEYHKPKLSRTELTGKDGAELPAPILGGITQEKGKK